MEFVHRKEYGPVWESQTGPLPFAEAEELYRLMLANFSGEERRICRIGGVLQKQRAEGDGPGKIEAATIGDAIEIGYPSGA